ncbi:MAG: hypothetical protein SPH77_02610 [Campylobacter sp.]|uniref:hypothetical protein n=1 Tax=Campylobacter sp. TaxID=205 RepID=UPI002A91C77C|nr:hypothetical protein [Campylobacter sp.]MDY6187709.1 hypothetical protein [Campylobacter sp.]
MKIKEKLAEINESIYQKFLANRRELFLWCSFFCGALCFASLYSLWLASPDGTPLEKMDKFSGKVIYAGYYSRKHGVGTLKLEQINGDVEYFEIDKSDEEIYNSVIGKWVKIYASKYSFSSIKMVEQLQNEKAEVLKKYDYLSSLERFKSTFTGFFFGGIISMALILGFILSQLVNYDLKKSKNKNNE